MGVYKGILQKIWDKLTCKRENMLNMKLVLGKSTGIKYSYSIDSNWPLYFSYVALWFFSLIHLCLYINEMSKD